MTTATGTRFSPSAASPLFLLAMDHRNSFAETILGVPKERDSSELKKLRDSKLVIYDGARRALAEGVSQGRAGVLVDEHLGSAIARRAKQDGFVLVMPIERSGTQLLELEYGEKFAAHVEKFDPDFVKVLVRYNPADDESTRVTQIERLDRISRWAQEVDRQWLVELLIPPTGQQLAQYEDQSHFDEQARPTLTAETLTAMREGGVHPTVWKLEGYETTGGAEEVLRTVAADREHPAECIVLGRNAPMARVEHWIETAAPLSGFAGFAVGRSIWQEPLLGFLGGQIKRSEAVESIAARYRMLIDDYSAHLHPSAPQGSDSFTWQNPRLTPDREQKIRQALRGADIRGTKVPAWMAVTLLAEVDALRSEVPTPAS
jgi:myo-inositol catabolism protein IolC